MSRLRWLLTAVVALLIASPAMPESKPASVKGTFVVGGADAHLKHVRAKRVKLDEKGKPGYAVLLSERPATGDFSDWRMADPSKRGSFIFLLLEKSGDIWVAELGHAQAKSGRFGVVTELRKVAFDAAGERLAAHVTTGGEQTFTDDRYSVDLTFDAPLEP